MRVPCSVRIDKSQTLKILSFAIKCLEIMATRHSPATAWYGIRLLLQHLLGAVLPYGLRPNSRETITLR